MECHSADRSNAFFTCHVQPSQWIRADMLPLPIQYKLHEQLTLDRRLNYNPSVSEPTDILVINDGFTCEVEFLEKNISNELLKLIV